MPTFREFMNRLQFLRRRARFDRELHDELHFHLEARAADFEDQGLSKDEALRRARIEFGSVQLAREDSREAWLFQWLEHLLMDLRVGARMLWRSPVFPSSQFSASRSASAPTPRSLAGPKASSSAPTRPSLIKSA